MKVHDERKDGVAGLAPLMEEICCIVDRAVPEHWKRITLTLTRMNEGFGSLLSHRIESPEGYPQSVSAPAELNQALQKLEELLVERDAIFQRAVIWISRGRTDWSIHIEYDLQGGGSAEAP